MLIDPRHEALGSNRLTKEAREQRGFVGPFMHNDWFNDPDPDHFTGTHPKLC